MVILLAVAALLVLGGILYARSRNDTPQPASTNEGNVNYGPQTDEEKKETEEFKKEQEQKANETPSAPSGSVTPIISYAGQYDTVVEASAYVPGIFEDGGTCTYIFTNGQTNIERSTTGAKDATTTRCPSVSVPVSDFNPKGNWTVVTKYQSNTSTGSSANTNIEVK